MFTPALLIGFLIGTIATCFWFVITEPERTMERIEHLQEADELTEEAKENFRKIHFIECPHCKKEIDTMKIKF